MNCCQCAGSCMHIGPHAYCATHRGSAARYIPAQPIISTASTTLAPSSIKCGACGSTAIFHTDKQCERNQKRTALQGGDK